MGKGMKLGKLENLLDEHELWLYDRKGGKCLDLSWKKINISCSTRLAGEDLSGASLNRTVMLNFDLKGTKLVGASLSSVFIKYSDLRCADFEDAELYSAKLKGNDLRYANFKGAYLVFADLSYADLRNCDFSGANMSGCHLGDADLRHVKIDNVIGQSIDIEVLNEEEIRYWNHQSIFTEGSFQGKKDEYLAYVEEKYSNDPEMLTKYQKYIKSKGRIWGYSDK